MRGIGLIHGSLSQQVDFAGMSDTTDLFAEIIAAYPESLRSSQRADIERQRYHLGTIARLLPPGGKILDIGGGVGMFGVACAAAGFEVTVVDDSLDPVHVRYGPDAYAAHRRYGVTVVERDVIADGLEWGPGEFDAITTFDSMEHWHASPKRLFRQVVDVLKPGGWFLLGVPNALNLRKRIAVPLGRAKWSQMADWYEQPVFRGHVREPDVADLRYIAHDMGLLDVRVDGRNWLGLKSPRPGVARAARLADVPLRRFPQLCSDIYLLGRTAK